MRLKHLVISLLLPGAALAQPLAEVGSYGKNVGTVAVDLNRGVVNDGTALRVIDLANPASPRLAGSVELGAIPQGTFVVDRTAYVPSPTGAFSVIDISDADAPEVIATEDWVAWKQSVWVRRLKDYAYVGTCETVEIIDLSNPSDPQRVGNLGPLGACVDAITGDGGYLYVATNGSDTRVRIYSLAEPSAPVLIGSEPGNSTYSRWTGNIAVFGDRLYVGQTDGNRVYDIADRTSPRYLRELSSEDRYFEGTFAVDRGLLYVADWENLDVWTLASPSAPTLLRGIPGGPGHQVKQVAAFQGRSLAARTHELTFADTSTGTVQSILSPTPGVGYVGTMAEANGLLYMGTGAGIAVVSLSSPTEPSLVHEMYARWSADMKVEGGFLYNLSAWGFLEVYSLATPSQPSLIADHPVTGGLDSLRLDVTANRLAVVGGDQVRFFERLPNGTLIERSVRSLPNFGNGVALKDSTAYVALGNGSLQVWSVADLTNPVLLSTLPVLDHQPERDAFNADAEVEGDRLHLLYGRHGYAVLNNAVPQTPVMMGTYETFEFEGSSVQPSGNVVYLATFGWNGRDGLSALNISDPSNITVSSSIRATGLVRDVIAASGYVYTAESEGCLRVRNAVQGSTTNNVFGGFIIH